MDHETTRQLCYQTLMTGYIVASIWAGWCNKQLATVDRLAVAWYIFDGLIHSTLEASFVYVSIGDSAQNSTSVFAHMWRDYGTADRRYLEADPCIVAMEIPIVFVIGPLAFILAYAVIKDTFYRHYLQIAICSVELYGDWMTFGPDLFSKESSISTDSFYYFWCNMVFFNIVWVVVPVALLLQSWNYMRLAYIPRDRLNIARVDIARDAILNRDRFATYIAENLDSNIPRFSRADTSDVRNRSLITSVRSFGDVDSSGDVGSDKSSKTYNLRNKKSF